MTDAPTLTAERIEELQQDAELFAEQNASQSRVEPRLAVEIGAQELLELLRVYRDALARSALNALGREEDNGHCGESTADRIWREQPATRAPTVSECRQELELVYKEARGLAEYLWRSRYAETAPDWKPLETLRGVLSQLDNMLAGLAPAPSRDKLCEQAAQAAFDAFTNGNAQLDDIPDYQQVLWHEVADAVLALLPSLTPSVPVGWRLVPVEPTEAMLNGARDWSKRVNGIGVGNDQATGCWSAMLNAAPPHSPEGV